MQFLRCAQVALLVSGALLASLSLPLARFRGEQFEVRFNESVVFAGELRSLSGAYVPLAVLLSLGAGSAGFSLAAWRQTSRRLQQSQRQVETLEGLVQQRDRQLQATQLSPQRLEQVGLHYFLSGDGPEQAAAVTQAVGGQQPSPQPAPPAAPLRPLAAAPAAAYPALQSLPMATSTAEIQRPAPPPALQDVAAPQRPSFLVINPYQPQVQVPSSRAVPPRVTSSVQRSAWPS